MLLLTILALCATVLALRQFLARLSHDCLIRSGILEIDKMDGLTFEKYLEALFVNLGYEVERTRHTGDFGTDLILKKNGIRTAGQAKRHYRSVGVKAVQEIVAAKGHYRCDAALVVTNSTFSQSSITLATSNQVALWDRPILIQRLLSVSVAVEQTATIDAARPLPTTLSAARCVVCGVAVSDKVEHYCRSYSQRFGGEVYCFEHQRARRKIA